MLLNEKFFCNSNGEHDGEREKKTSATAPAPVPIEYAMNIFFFACLIQYVYLYATAIGSHTMQICSCSDVRSSNQMKIMYYILRGFIFASKIAYAWNEIKIYTKNEQHQQQKHRRKRDKKTRKRISSHANFDMQVNKTRESHTRTYIGTFMTAK